jgi:putative transcriptional regulator
LLVPALLGLVVGATITGGSQAPVPAAGMLLVARSELPDPNFSRTVVLLLHYDEGGAAGVILDRPTGHALAELLPDVAELAERRDVLYIGGPVSPNALLLLVRTASKPEGSDEVLPGVHTAAGMEQLRPLLDQGIDQDSLRAYAGYAGWAPGQLDAEIERGDWHLYPATAERVFSDRPQELWGTLHRFATSPIV